MIEYCTLADSSLSELTEAWNRCWQGYYYEFNFSEAHMRAWLQQCQIVLHHSIALRNSGKIIGFSLLSVENKDGWIAGTSIDPGFRGRHLFSSLMTAQIYRAFELGLKQLRLEVLTQNYAARVYEKVGFKRIRELNIYRISTDVLNPNSLKTHESPFKVSSLSDYFDARLGSNFSPSWQRRENYLKRYSVHKAWLNPSRTSGMLFTGEHSSMLLDAWTVSGDQVEELLYSILQRTKGELNLTNQPKDWISAYLTSQGIRPSNTQYEMVYTW